MIIKPADKGSGTILMDKTWYMDECNRLPTPKRKYQVAADIQKRVTVYVNRMHKDKKLINDKTRQYLIQSDVKPGRFYILPKVHIKPGNHPGCPIVSSNHHPLNACHPSLTTTFSLYSINCRTFLRTLTTSLTNSLPLVIYPLIPY